MKTRPEKPITLPDSFLLTVFLAAILLTFAGCGRMTKKQCAQHCADAVIFAFGEAQLSQKHTETMNRIEVAEKNSCPPCVCRCKAESCPAIIIEPDPFIPTPVPYPDIPLEGSTTNECTPEKCPQAFELGPEVK